MEPPEKTYEALEKTNRGAPKRHNILDLSDQYIRLHHIPEDDSNKVRAIVAAWCSERSIEILDLRQQEVRVTLWGDGPDVVLAWPGYGRIGGRRTVTAIKYRNLATDKRSAHPGSTFGEPMVIGDRSSQDWFICEGETDAARIHNLTKGAVAIMILPAGALTIREGWVGVIPRRANVYLAHDNDSAGDTGAAKAARLVGSAAIRLSPPGKDWGEFAGNFQDFAGLVSAARSNSRTRIKTFGELLEEYRVERSGSRDPVHLGWGSIDADIRGVSDGQVLGIAARTAVGKTWGLNSIIDFFGKTQIGTLVASLEMPGAEWAERQLAVFNDIAPEEVEKWAKGQRELDTTTFTKAMASIRLCDENAHMSELPILLNETRLRLSVPLRCIVIDYLGLLGVPGRDAYERTSAIGKGLKQLAKDEHISVIVAMQLSRAAGDGSTEVTLEMLRDSGVLEESLDFLIGCWRPGKSNLLSREEKKQLQNVMRVSILKNRKGREGRIVDLLFRPQSQRVYESVI